ncbi:hypothetical protein RI367_000645 [Sorochytrium milnesiophthora]
MLGGYSSVSLADAAESTAFLSQFLGKGDLAIGTERACDCGAGIGRVTKMFLSKHFRHVDLVEQDAHFLETARQDAALAGIVEQFVHSGLQDFAPEAGRYDLIWCQWVLSYLTDVDLVRFLRRCAEAVQGDGRRGMLCVKENVIRDGNSEKRVDVDHEDSSVTRSEAVWRGIIAQAGLVVVKEAWQNRWPTGLYAVKMWALTLP